MFGLLMDFLFFSKALWLLGFQFYLRYKQYCLLPGRLRLVFASPDWKKGHMSTHINMYTWSYISCDGIVIHYRLDSLGFEPQWRWNFRKPPRPAPSPPQPPVQGVMRLFLRGKWPRNGVDHTPPSSTKVKKRVGLCLSLPHAFIICYREDFTFFIF